MDKTNDDFVRRATSITCLNVQQPRISPAHFIQSLCGSVFLRVGTNIFFLFFAYMTSPLKGLHTGGSFGATKNAVCIFINCMPTAV